MEKIEANLGPTWWRARKNQEERVKMEKFNPIQDQPKWWQARKDQGGRSKMEKFNPI